MKTFKLIDPIKYGGTETSDISIRNPIVTDMVIASDKSKDDKTKVIFHLICNLSGLLPEQIRDLDWTDYQDIAEYVSELLVEATTIEADKTKKSHRSIKIDLEKSVEVDGKSYSFIEIRRPKVEDVEHAEAVKNEHEQDIELLSRISGLSTRVIGHFDFCTDFTKARSYMNLFLGITD